MWTYVSAHELYHYGVKGMRWGVRKARRENEKIDKSFKNWNTNAKNKGFSFTFRASLQSKNGMHQRIP